MSPFSWQCQNLCKLSLAFIIDWRVVRCYRELYIFLEDTVSTVTSSIDPKSNAPVAEPSTLTPHPPISRRIAAVSRTRQESTSLHTHPIKDDDLQDFHQHRLLTGYHSLDVKYNLYGMVVSEKQAASLINFLFFSFNL